MQKHFQILESSLSSFYKIKSGKHSLLINSNIFREVPKEVSQTKNNEYPIIMSKSSKQSQSTIKTSWRESESDSKLISPSKTSIIWILMCTWNRSFCELNLSIINSEDHRFTGGCYHLPHKSGDIQQAWECLLFSWMTLASLGKSKKTAVCRLVSTLVTITYSLILGIIMVISNMNPHCRQGEILKYSYLRQKSPLPCCHRLPGFGLTLIVCFQYCQKLDTDEYWEFRQLGT